MKFACVCGHQVRDQTDYLPYKAEILRDEDGERFWDAVDAAVARCANNSPGESAEADERYSLMRAWLAYTVHAYECEACGRLYVERERGGELVAFVPASGRPERVLASPHGSPVGAPTESKPPAG